MIDLSSKETRNQFSDSFGFKNPVLDFLKDTHPLLASRAHALDFILYDTGTVHRLYLNGTAELQ